MWCIIHQEFVGAIVRTIATSWALRFNLFEHNFFLTKRKVLRNLVILPDEVLNSTVKSITLRGFVFHFLCCYFWYSWPVVSIRSIGHQTAKNHSTDFEKSSCQAFQNLLICIFPQNSIIFIWNINLDGKKHGNCISIKPPQIVFQ